ncbi:putative iron-regulated membrane protein [Kushneria sinocarnis]|uniref:Putative iron-regulated membrane protein n=1 Tax=Kushneria sinocarnis TaxID=595502 RepID=A0A420WWQ6_9GAMM|nr:PepSY-associated TM helix domain-containing protein [Kushneria sinocarnis]RKR03539.1 putative iron-regulated membrane protein [Kushneria sinocarnis]
MTTSTSRTASARKARSETTGMLMALLMRLHFHVGLLVGPFLLVAATSGLLYALTPQLENAVFHHQLYTDARGPTLPLAEQIGVARGAIGDEARLSAVRPAPAPGNTTRVMFHESGMGPSDARAIFVDPVTGEVRGDLPVYGTSGALPLRTWIDKFHRSLLLGDWGRLYSELAASWLWVVALGGLVLWRQRRRRVAAGRERPAGMRRWHGTLGAWLMLGLLFFSATGLTWSQWAGGNIAVLRTAWGWGTPSVSTRLEGSEPTPAQTAANVPHTTGGATTAAAGGVTPERFDGVLAAARQAGLEAGKIEIIPPARADQAWQVREIDRGWPTRVDEAAIDPKTLEITDRTRFENFPLAAKLTRWGIDAHMGSLFGLANQLLLVMVASGLIVMIVLGYRLWWQRRPTRYRHARPPLAILRRLPWPLTLGIVSLAALVGWALPVMGASLLAFLVIDSLLLYYRQRRERAASTEASS